MAGEPGRGEEERGAVTISSTVSLAGGSRASRWRATARDVGMQSAVVYLDLGRGNTCAGRGTGEGGWEQGGWMARRGY